MPFSSLPLYVVHTQHNNMNCKQLSSQFSYNCVHSLVFSVSLVLAFQAEMCCWINSGMNSYCAKLYFLWFLLINYGSLFDVGDSISINTQLLNDITETREYCQLKETAPHRILCRQLWRKMWTCRKADCIMNEIHIYVMTKDAKVGRVALSV
jgi:hypothetical protein